MMGITLDEDEINAMANKTASEEWNLRYNLVEKKREIEDELAKTRRATETALSLVRTEMDKKAAEIRAMEHLSETERAGLMKQLRAETETKMNKVVERANAVNR